MECMPLYFLFDVRLIQGPGPRVTQRQWDRLALRLPRPRGILGILSHEVREAGAAGRVQDGPPTMVGIPITPCGGIQPCSFFGS